MKLKKYKLVFKKDIPKKKCGYINRGENVCTNVIPYFKYLLTKNKIRIKGDKSGVYFLISSSVNPLYSISFQNPEIYFENEMFYKYDFLTEFTNLQDYLNNPMSSESRYALLSYDELKRKGFMILKKHVDNTRVYKSQKVAYYLYHNTNRFPAGWMVENNKPQDVIIRLDMQYNQVRIEGPNCISIWNKYNIQGNS